MAIYDFFLSRNSSNITANTYIGHAGRLFYDDTNGVVKLSDGVTPGGSPIPITIATESIVGGIKAGPGFAVDGTGLLTLRAGPTFFLDETNTFRLRPGTADQIGGIKAGSGVVITDDGTLTIDASGLPVSFGNLFVDDTTISSVNENANISIEANGTGNVDVRGGFNVFDISGTFGSEPVLRVLPDGQIRMLVPAADPSLGALEIVGNNLGVAHPPNQTGVILHVTGNTDDISRNYFDASNNYSLIVGRRYNGLAANVTPVLAGESIFRIAGQASTDTGFEQFGIGRIEWVATQDQAPGAQGGEIQIYATANNTSGNSAVKVAAFSADNGATLYKKLTTGNIAPDTNNIYDLGSADMRWKATYVGPGGMFIRDTNDTVDAQMTISNGVLFINGIEGLTAGNLYFQNNSILSLQPQLDINIGNVFPGEGNLVLNRVTNVTKDLYANGNIFVSGSIFGNATTTTANVGNLNVGVSGTISTPRIVFNDGGLRSIQDGIYANISLNTDSIVHHYNPSGDVTVNVNGHAVGAVVRLIISMDTRRTINLGVAAARNSTTGATSIPNTSLLNGQCVQLVYTCIDGTEANTYVAVSRV
jgi:hypothetical protein